MTQSTEQERAEFEAAYVAEKLRILDSEGSADGEKAIRAVMLRRNASSDYDNSLEAHFSWWAWQASAARRTPGVDDLPQRMVDTMLSAAPKPPETETDSLGIPKSCGKPLCSPSKHHPLCDLADHFPDAEKMASAPVQLYTERQLRPTS